MFKSKSKLFLNVFALMLVILVAGVNYAEAQFVCKRCKINKTTKRFDCIDSSKSGAVLCSIGNDGSSCTVETGCSLQGFQEIVQQATMSTRYAIKFNPQLIRDIALKQPRFAATLVNLHKQGTFSDSSIISWIGEKFSYEDLEYLLQQVISPGSNNPPTNYFTSERAYKSEDDVPIVDHSIAVMKASYKEIKIIISAVDSAGKENYTLELTAGINSISKQSGAEIFGLVINNWELK